MGADRNPALGQQANRLCEPDRAFNLDHVRASSHQLRAVIQGLLEGRIGHKRQIGKDQSVLIPALDARHVVRHFVIGDWQRAVMPL